MADLLSLQITLTPEAKSVHRLHDIVTHQRKTRQLGSMTKTLIIDLGLLWYPTLGNGNSGAVVPHPYLSNFSAPSIGSSLARLQNLESVTITTRDVDAKLGPWVFKDFSPGANGVAALEPP